MCKQVLKQKQQCCLSHTHIDIQRLTNRSLLNGASGHFSQECNLNHPEQITVLVTDNQKETDELIGCNPDSLAKALFITGHYKQEQKLPAVYYPAVQIYSLLYPAAS